MTMRLVKEMRIAEIAVMVLDFVVRGGIVGLEVKGCRMVIWNWKMGEEYFED